MGATTGAVASMMAPSCGSPAVGLERRSTGGRRLGPVVAVLGRVCERLTDALDKLRSHDAERACENLLETNRRARPIDCGGVPEVARGGRLMDRLDEEKLEMLRAWGEGLVNGTAARLWSTHRRARRTRFCSSACHSSSPRSPAPGSAINGSNSRPT